MPAPTSGRRDARPRYLNLLQIRLPVTAVASILHRFSGLLLVLLTPVLIYLLDLSLNDPHRFRVLAGILAGPAARVLLLVAAWALAYHLLAGLRFLGLDVGLGEPRLTARRTAWASLGLGVLLALLVGAGL
jgi:succinate dehydrogenase / fumarate reductase cytochrome b subunit